MADPTLPPYLVRALLEIALIAPVAGAVGVLAVLRRQAFTAHAIGVGALPGTVLALAVGLPVLLGGLAAGVALALLALLIGADRRRGDASTVTGVLLAGALGLGALLVSAGVGGSGARIDGLLFGSLLGITDGDLVRSALVLALVGVVLVGFARVFAFAAFDPEGARAAGLPVPRHDLVLGAAIACVVVVAVEAVGAVLASALVVLPAAAALRLAVRVPTAMALAALLALVAGVAGVLLADRWSIPPGATVVAVAALLWPLAELAARLRRGGLRPVAVAAASALVIVIAACGGTAATTTDAPSAAETAASTTASTAASTAAETEAAAEPLRVVATTPIVADWVRAVGGDDVDVTTIVPAGIEVHDFEPTPEAARAIADAAVVFSSGAGLDEWADQLVEGAGGDVELVELAPEDRLLAPAEAAPADEHGHGHDDDHGHDDEKAEDAHDHGDIDPHYWHDPTRAALAVDAIAAALAAADPARADAFVERAAAYDAELEALDAELAAAVDAVPADRRLLVTDHDAFAYLADRYGLEVVGAAIPSTSGAASADAQSLADLVALIRERGVPAVFSESTADPQVAATLADETGARLVDGLYADTLGPEGSETGTYVGMMRGNVLLIAEGLRG